MRLCPPQWHFSSPFTGQYIVGSEFKGYESQGVSTSLARSASTQPRGLSQCLCNLWPLATGESPSFCRQAIPQFPPPLYSGLSRFKFTISAAQTCWGRPLLCLRQNNVWVFLFCQGPVMVLKYLKYFQIIFVLFSIVFVTELLFLKRTTCFIAFAFFRKMLAMLSIVL